jgi:hypothetical protein
MRCHANYAISRLTSQSSITTKGLFENGKQRWMRSTAVVCTCFWMSLVQRKSSAASNMHVHPLMPG